MLASLMSVPQRKLRHLRSVDRDTQKELIKRQFHNWLFLLFYPLLIVLAAAVRVVLEVLRPFVHIRFGRLWAWSLGQYVTIESYLCERDLGIQPKHSFDIFYHYFPHKHTFKPPRGPKAICNQQLDLMIVRSPIHVWDSASKLDTLIRMLPGGSKNFTVQMPAGPDTYMYRNRLTPRFSFTKQEEERGFEELEALGGEAGRQFVCFHARDSAYLERALPRITSIYGDWVEYQARDASITNYLVAVNNLVDMGYYAIRAGKYPKDPLNSDNPRIIDYGYESHSDFMDVFLSAHCTFFICSNSGMNGLPAIFATPIAYVNIMPLNNLHIASNPNSIFIPKKYYSADKGRLLRFQEIFADPRLGGYPGKGFSNSQEYFGQIGLEIHENTPEEITGIVLEMEQTLRGDFQPSHEDQELQSRLSSILGSAVELYPHLDVYQYTRMGAHFLRTHPELLE